MDTRRKLKEYIAAGMGERIIERRAGINRVTLRRVLAGTSEPPPKLRQFLADLGKPATNKDSRIAELEAEILRLKREVNDCQKQAPLLPVRYPEAEDA